MEEDRNSQEEDDSSLVEIEVAEEEEIEVEESETESENDNPASISEEPKKVLSPPIKNKEEKIENEEEKEENNKEKQYSELELKIIELMNGSETVNNLLNINNKWDEKKKGLMLLNEFILKTSNEKKILTNFEMVFNYIQDALKNFKESNFMLLKEGMECICSLFNIIKNNNVNNDTFNKKYFNILITELNEKIIDIKLKNVYLKLINLLMDVYSPNDIINYIIQIINESNKVVLLKEYALFIKNYINSKENNIKLLNVKEIIDFCIKIGNNNNQQLRALSTEIISLIYNYIGDEYISYVKKNIKDSTFKTIEQKIKQTNKYDSNNDPFNNSLNEKKNSNEINSIKNSKNAFMDNYNKEIKNKNRVDISKDISPVLLKYINYGKWNEKKEGIEFIHSILSKNKNHVLINGLQELIDLIIEKLSDSNKNLVRLMEELLSHLVEALGPQLKPYTKKIMNPLITNLSDKNSILRQECISCINKWISVIQNFEVIFILIPPFLLNDNYDMRNELLNLLINNIHLIKKQNIYIGHFDDLINSLLVCLQDKSLTIRNNTEKLIQLNMNIIPRENYIKSSSQFKPAIAMHLNTIINSIYGFKESLLDEIVKRDRSLSLKRRGNYLSPKKLKLKNIEDDDDQLSPNKNEIKVKHRATQSIERNNFRNNSFLKFDSKENREKSKLKDKNESLKKKLIPAKTSNEVLINITKKNKPNVSFTNTLENFNTKQTLKRKNENNLDNSSMNNINNSNILNNSTINNNSMAFKNNNIRFINSSIKRKKKNNQMVGSIPNIAMRVNKFYNNNKYKRISNVKQRLNNNNNDLNKENSKNKKMFKKKEIKNEQNNPNNLQRNRYFSPNLVSKFNNSKSKNSFLYESNNLNTSENYFYKRMYSNHLNKNLSMDKMGSFNQDYISNKSETHIKGNLFLESYKIKKEQKEKRIEEDKRNNYYFEIQNFEQIPKIKEIMKNIFCSDFIDKIFGDNIKSIIACINKLKSYIENNTNNDNIFNIEDNLDILLKVIGYKLYNNKSSSLIISTFEFIDSLLSSYKSQRIFLTDIESNIILNILVDKLINNSSGIKDTAVNLIWSITNMIGEERSLLIIMHLIEYKNIKTKNESLNIIIKLYKDLLSSDKYILDNWKIKIVKNIISLYFEGDHNNKNKLLFIIKDIYSSYGREIWKHCKSISSKNKDELLKKIRENPYGDKLTFENEYQTLSTKNIFKNNTNYLFNSLKNDEHLSNKNKKVITKRNEQIVLKTKNPLLTKVKLSIIYNKKNKKIFENRKKIKLDNEDLSFNQSSQNNDVIESKKSGNLWNKDNDDNGTKIKLKKGNKNINTKTTIRDSTNSLKNNKFLTHINTAQNIHDNLKYEKLINPTNKLVLMNDTDEIDNFARKKGKNNLSQSTVIINNNYNFIKIKNNENENKKKGKKFSEKNSKKNIIINNNNKIREDNKNNINVIHSNLSNDGFKKKIIVNCNKKEKFNEIKKILESLSSYDKEDMTELILKVHNILYTNYKKNESILINHCDYIFDKLIQTINNLLDKKRIYTNYIKYISNILCKICKLGELLSKINLDTQNNLIILTIKTVSFLNDKDNNNEKDINYYNNSEEDNEVIIKCFNSIMLRIIDFCDINNTINLLMNYEKKYRKTNKEIVSYVAKCLIIIIKNIKDTYDKIDIGIIVENIFNLLEELENNNNIVINNKTDQIIIITIKNILSQLIVYRGDKELVEYIINKNKLKSNDKKSIFDYDSNEAVKNWLLQYIKKLKNHKNKKNENNDNEMSDKKTHRKNEYDEDDN